MVMIIALQACRHGIGCSNLGANLAVTLMQQGYRVGLFDADTQMGGLRTLFGVDRCHTQESHGYWWLHRTAASAQTLQAEFRHYHEVHCRSTAGIYLPPAEGDLSLQDPPVQPLCRHYDQTTVFAAVQGLSEGLALDFVLIDNQPEMTQNTLTGLSIADVVLVLLQLESFDLQQAAVILEVVNRLEINQTWLIPSMVLPMIEREVVQTTLENTFDYPVPGVLYFTEEMISLASKGIFCLHYPDHVMTQTATAIADHLIAVARTNTTTSAKN
jgi:MinD-like ATPase involved in chromosome partitioning or flagellar assembly